MTGAARRRRIVRFAGADGRPRLGLVEPAAPTVVRSLPQPDAVATIAGGLHAGDPVVAALDPETWCAGVTYQRSRDARLEEADTP